MTSSRLMPQFALQIVVSKVYEGGREESVSSDEPGVCQLPPWPCTHIADLHPRTNTWTPPPSLDPGGRGLLEYTRETAGATGREVRVHYRPRRRCAPVRVCALLAHAVVMKWFSRRGH